MTTRGVGLLLDEQHRISQVGELVLRVNMPTWALRHLLLPTYQGMWEAPVAANA